MPRERDDAPWAAGPVRVRRVRGPNAAGETYWRATLRDTKGDEPRLVWAGWGRRRDPTLTQFLIAEANRPPPDPALDYPDPHLVRGMLGLWKADQQRRHQDGEIRARSLAIYEGQIRHLVAGLGQVVLDRLDLDAVRDYVTARKTSGASSRTIRGELVALGAAWKHARRIGRAPDHDLALPEVKQTPVRQKATPTRAQLLKVLEHLEAGSWVRRAVVLLFSTGARLSEVAYLRWRDVDADKGLMTLHGKGDPRSVPIARDLMRELGARGEPDELVVGASPLTTRSRLLDHLEEACRRAKVPRFTPHGLRRLAVNALYEAGEDVGTVAGMLGQSPQVALQYYRQARPDQMRKALDRAGLGIIPRGQVLQMGEAPESDSVTNDVTPPEK